MQVILLEKIRNLGDLGETVNVKSGFGRNFLIPHGKAVFATERNVELFESRRDELEAKAAKCLSEAEAVAKQLEALALQLDVLSSDEGKLYGSIGPNEVAKAIADAGVEISRKDVIMPLGAIHEVGVHQVDVQLHSDVNVTLNVTVGNPEELQKAREEVEAAKLESESGYFSDDDLVEE